MLKNAEDAADAARKARHVPAMLEELKLSGGALIAKAQPAHPDDLQAMIMKFFLGLGLKDRDVAEHKAALALWMDALGNLPLDAVRVGITEAARTCLYLPKPADVYMAALPHAQELQLIAYRAKRALEEAGKAAPPKSAKMTHAEMKAAGFMDENGKIILAPPKPIPPNTPAVRLTPHELAEKLRRHGEQGQ